MLKLFQKFFEGKLFENPGGYKFGWFGLQKATCMILKATLMPIWKSHYLSVFI